MHATGRARRNSRRPRRALSMWLAWWLLAMLRMSATGAVTPDCSDSQTHVWCARKLEENKCQHSFVWAQCSLTCGMCTAAPPVLPSLPRPPSAAPRPPAPPPLPGRPFVCTGHWKAFDKSLDVINLHYDCAADPDDLTSSVADRTLLERVYGTTWLRSRVIPVIGTFGKNTYYQEAQCERVAQAVWGDSTGFLRASWPSAPAAIGASVRELAVEHVERAWAAAIARGGQVYVKEGGQSDFTQEGENHLSDAFFRLHARSPAPCAPSDAAFSLTVPSAF